MRAQFIKDNCTAVETKSYMKQYSEEQMEEHRMRLAEAAIKLDDLEEENKALIEEFKERMKPLQEEKKKLLNAIRTRCEYVTETCFKYVDISERRTAYYNDNGENIEERNATIDELQVPMFSAQEMTGTDY